MQLKLWDGGTSLQVARYLLAQENAYLHERLRRAGQQSDMMVDIKSIFAHLGEYLGDQHVWAHAPRQAREPEPEVYDNAGEDMGEEEVPHADNPPEDGRDIVDMALNGRSINRAPTELDLEEGGKENDEEIGGGRDSRDETCPIHGFRAGRSIRPRNVGRPSLRAHGLGQTCTNDSILQRKSAALNECTSDTLERAAISYPRKLGESCELCASDLRSWGIDGSTSPREQSGEQWTHETLQPRWQSFRKWSSSSWELPNNFEVFFSPRARRPTVQHLRVAQVAFVTGQICMSPIAQHVASNLNLFLARWGVTI